jgi:hypothetical protein
MVKLGGEILRGVSPSSFVTVASGITAGIEGHKLAIQDLSINVTRAANEDLLSRFGVAVAILGLIIMAYDYRRAHRTQADLPK